MGPTQGNYVLFRVTVPEKVIVNFENYLKWVACDIFLKSDWPSEFCIGHIGQACGVNKQPCDITCVNDLSFPPPNALPVPPTSLLPPYHPSHPSSAILMSPTPPMNAPPQLNFQSTLNNALHEYKKQTREDLFLHPLAAKLQPCDSPHAILSVLQEEVSDERLTNWLGPVVNVIYGLSSSLGEEAGPVSY